MIADQNEGQQTDQPRREAEAIFKRQIGVTDIESGLDTIGNQVFLNFVVGREAPIYERAITATQRGLPETSPFRGLLRLVVSPEKRFPRSLEASVLLSTLTRATRHIAPRAGEVMEPISYVPFQSREDDKVIQPATHLIVGRRGVGKTTLIMRAAQLFHDTNNVPVLLDMQAYAQGKDEGVYREVLSDLATGIVDACEEHVGDAECTLPLQALADFAEEILGSNTSLDRAAPKLRRVLSKITKELRGELYLFLDDYHTLPRDLQPALLHLLHGACKGAGCWLKVAGIRSMLTAYDPGARKGLQVPGDAQLISLDLTLVDPETAESHLRAILTRFLEDVGYSSTKTAIMEPAFQRLVWANAGVPRDFLQMFGKSLEHARRVNRPRITVTDANLAIGEFGQQKMDDLQLDARNEENTLRRVVEYLERYCLEKNKINAFLVRSEQSRERDVIQALSDLRIVHLIHPTITPHKAGQRYEAYLLDYSMFTGFRRRPNIKEMLPASSQQFRAGELRKIPALPRNFLSNLE